MQPEAIEVEQFIIVATPGAGGRRGGVGHAENSAGRF